RFLEAQLWLRSLPLPTGRGAISWALPRNRLIAGSSAKSLYFSHHFGLRSYHFLRVVGRFLRRSFFGAAEGNHLGSGSAIPYKIGTTLPFSSSSLSSPLSTNPQSSKMVKKWSMTSSSASSSGVLPAAPTSPARRPSAKSQESPRHAKELHWASAHEKTSSTRHGCCRPRDGLVQDRDRHGLRQPTN
ncbi:hypothetical protein BKA80DRAFT_267484, partial [Phyllosticta citrichinensis]